MSDRLRKHIDACTGAGGIKCRCCRCKKKRDRQIYIRIAKRKVEREWKKDERDEL